MEWSAHINTSLNSWLQHVIFSQKSANLEKGRLQNWPALWSSIARNSRIIRFKCSSCYVVQLSTGKYQLPGETKSKSKTNKRRQRSWDLQGSSKRSLKQLELKHWRKHCPLKRSRFWKISLQTLKKNFLLTLSLSRWPTPQSEKTKPGNKL
jgi:hypothetical protein